MPTRTNPGPKRVVYMWGAGATYAEAKHLGAATSILMSDTEDYGEGITSRILGRMGSNVISSYGSDQGVDIEKLISLLAASGIDEHSRLAERMRRAYFTELKVGLANAGVLNNSRLADHLFQLHRNEKFREEVEIFSGIITTNHDGLLQLVSQKAFGNVNLGFKFHSSAYMDVNSHASPAILQLHGSFAWKFDNPIKVAKLHRQSTYTDTVWIPPTILKEAKNYPFNKLTGLAYELLVKHCDVLRIIGASLTQNDWNILALVFNAQRHLEYTNGTPFPIQLIMPQRDGERIAKECAYLKNIFPIGYLTEGEFAAYKDPEKEPKPGMDNPFAYWLNEKTEYHRSRDELDVMSLHETAA